MLWLLVSVIFMWLFSVKLVDFGKVWWVLYGMGVCCVLF